MALINLKLIGELASGALLAEAMFEAHMLGLEHRLLTILDADIVAAVKINKQATNLLEQLKSLHQCCTDIVTDKLTRHMESYERYRDDETPPFDPFDLIRTHFDSGSIHDLPPVIEQYTALLQYASHHSRLQKAKREGLQKFFGNTVQLGYLVKDENGESSVIPESEMPEGVVHTMKANQEIRDIDVEYCLDKYNTFVQQCSALIKTHEQTGDYTTCAAEILKLYAPYPATKPDA